MLPSRTLLLVEDDPGHARLVERSLRRAGFEFPIRVFTDGATVLEHVRGLLVAGADDIAASCLVLLDLRMPRVGGIEVLSTIRADPRLAALPVVVISTTDDPDDLAAARLLGCQGFLVKPVLPAELFALLERAGLQAWVPRPTPDPPAPLPSPIATGLEQAPAPVRAPERPPEPGPVHGAELTPEPGPERSD